MSTPKLWFAGTPEFAAHSLQALIEDDAYEVSGVLTQPDRPAGRGRQLRQSAVKQLAQRHGIAIEQPAKLREDDPPFAHLDRPDLVIVAAYGLLLPSWFLAYPRLGCLNIHASLLPRWRGAAPIQRAIQAGDKESGITIMQMDAGLDTGDMWLRKRCAITSDMTGGELHNKLMALGAQAILEALPLVLAQTTQPSPQADEHANYAHKLSKDEALIDWSNTAEYIARQIRAFDPYPVAHTTLEGKTWRIFTASVCPISQVSQADSDNDQLAGTIISHDENGVMVVTGDGTLCIKKIQIAGKKRTDAASLRHGHSIVGKRFAT